MSVLICGSMAYDTIMVFPDHFKNHILPEQVHILSVSFLVPEMRKEFGGCAGNIAYNLKGLGGDPLIMATVGNDFAPYAKRLERLAIRQDGIREVPGEFTAQCFITTDLDDNQITAFHPGAMMQSHQNAIPDGADVSLALIGPDGKDGMQHWAKELDARKIPFIFDPGQAMPIFSGEELLAIIDRARYLALNDYEAQLMTSKTGLSLEALAERVEALIVTLGGEGSRIYTGGRVIEIPCAPAAALLDPTGCGDAYRAGLLYGITAGWDWETTGRLASLLGSLKIAQRGGQNHSLDAAALKAAYRAAFNADLPL